jgi:enoyl-CoA hydratase/carnithine racemase
MPANALLCFMRRNGSMSESLLLERKGRVLIATINRPEKRNALNAQLCDDIVGAMENANDDASIGAILLQSAGNLFCAGMDLGEVMGPEASGLHAMHDKIFTLWARMVKPIVASIQGSAHGGGIGLVANAHIAVAASNAVFSLSEIRLGLWPYLIYRSLIMAIGERRALELSLTGRTINAAEALAYGLVHHIVPQEELKQRSYEIAKALALSSAEGICSGMEFGNKMRGMDWKEAGTLAQESRSRSFKSADFAEGVRAFQEKRLPRWPSLQTG